MSDPNAYTVEISAPDISPWRQGNTGIEYGTTIDSGKAGPHVLLTALAHGNEICGAIVLDELLRSDIRPLHGKLTLLFCNVSAFELFDLANPEASRWVEEDFNRVWTAGVLDGPRDSVDLRRARIIRPLVDAADLLLDIHSMQHPSDPLLLAGPLAKGRTWARRVGFPGMVVADAGHAAGKRMRDYGAFGDPASPRNALLVECGQHWERASAEVAIETMLRVLVDLRTIDPADAAPHLPGAPRPPARVIEVTDAVTVRSDDFAFVADYRGMEVVERAGTVIAHDGGVPVATPHDRCVLIMPSRRLRPGQTAVRLGRFVD